MPASTGTKALVASETVAHTPNIKRQSLIRNAIAVHKKHTKIFDNLSEDQKQRLQILAKQTMLGKVNKKPNS